MRVLLDTNFCLLLFEFKIDLVEEINRIAPERVEILIPNLVLEELKKISKKKGKKGVYAKNAIRYFSKFKIAKINKVDGVDKSLLDYAKRENCVIATQDQKIKREARKIGVPIITMRQKRYLMLIS